MKKKFKIPVTWEMFGFVEIEAESLEEAMDIAEGDDIELPDEKHYVDASWEVNRDVAEMYN